MECIRDRSEQCLTRPRGRLATGGCYALPPTPSATLNPDTWATHRGGPESATWAENSLFASARDVSRFGAMLANGGFIRASLGSD